jgi:chaperone modulatory protein CbpM
MERAPEQGDRVVNKTFTLIEVSKLTGLELSRIDAWIAMDWVSPLATESLDQEDIARLRLIHELQNDLGANDDSIPLILHLVDQLCHLQEVLRKLNVKSP